MLENPRHHNLFLLLLDIVHYLLLLVLERHRLGFSSKLLLGSVEQRQVLLGLNIRINLQDLVNSLFDHTHVDEHITLSDTLLTLQARVPFLVALNRLRNLGDTVLDLGDLHLVLSLLLLHRLNFEVGLVQLFLKFFDCFLLLRVLAPFSEIAVDFTLHFEDLGVEVLDLLVHFIHEFEQGKVLFLRVNEGLH